MARFKDTTKTSTQLLQDLAYHARSGVDPQIIRNLVYTIQEEIDGALSAAELAYLDAVTAGTVAASKAVVVDANKDVGDFRNVDVVNLDAGASGTAGTVDVFPTTASKGKLIISCTDQDADTTVTVKPAAMGQATVVSIPDPGAATANVVLTDAANDGVVVTATAAEINSVADLSSQDAMAASSAMDTALTSYDSAVIPEGGIKTTKIIFDLNGAKSTTTENDIIGDTGACHIGQITTAINGAIIGGRMTCLEAPATGQTDIDLSQASVDTGAYDADVTGLTNYGSLVAAAGAWTLGTTKYFGPVTADYYLYLSSGAAGTADTYSAGIFMIELFSV